VLGAVELVNQALAKLGQAQRLTTLDSPDAAAVLARSVLDVARRDELRRIAPHFARATATLAATVGSQNSAGWWYAFPADLIRLLGVEPLDAVPAWSVEGRGVRVPGDGQGILIYYVRDVLDPAHWDASFANLMATRLAWELAPALTQSDQTLAKLAREIEDARAAAAQADAHEGLPVPVAIMSEVEAARYVGF
jgi:hypothetical protein